METLLKAIPIFIGVVAVINALIGFGRGLKKSIFALAANATAIVVTVFLTPRLVNPLGNKFIGMFFSELGPELSNHDSFKNLVRIFGLSIVSVLSFAIVYALVYLLIRIIFSVVAGKKQKPKFLGRILAMVISAVNCAVFWGILILPVHTLVGNICEDSNILLNTKVESKAAADLIADYNEVMENFVPNGLVTKVAASRLKTGEILYDMLTPVKVGDRKSKAHAEALTLARTFSEILTKLPSTEADQNALNKDTIKAVKEIKEICFRSDLLREIFVETVNDVCLTWSEGRAYIGIEDPAKGTDYEKSVKEIYARLAVAKPGEIDSTLDLMINLLNVAATADLMNSVQGADSQAALFEALNDKETITSIFESINEDNASMITDILSASTGENAEGTGAINALITAIGDIPAEERELEVEATMKGLDVASRYMEIEDKNQQAAFIVANIDEILEVTTSSKVLAGTVANMAENGEVDVELSTMDKLLVQAAVETYYKSAEEENKERIAEVLNTYAEVLGIRGIK